MSHAHHDDTWDIKTSVGATAVMWWLLPGPSKPTGPTR